MAVINDSMFASELSLSTDTSKGGRRTMRLFNTSKALIETYTLGSTGIHDSILSEAMLRVGGYLAQTRHNPALVSRRVDDLSLRYSPKLSGVMVRSGAEAILSPFVRRRALS